MLCFYDGLESEAACVDAPKCHLQLRAAGYDRQARRATRATRSSSKAASTRRPPRDMDTAEGARERVDNDRMRRCGPQPGHPRHRGETRTPKGRHVPCISVLNHSACAIGSIRLPARCPARELRLSGAQERAARAESARRAAKRRASGARAATEHNAQHSNATYDPAAVTRTQRCVSCLGCSPLSPEAQGRSGSLV